jgi:hypothetical protein
MVEFEAELWVWEARRTETWTFVSLPVEASEEIRELTAGAARGFGSVKVRASIGGSTWTTSIFPGGGGYVLPVKKAVRRAEGVEPGDVMAVAVELIQM